MSPAPRVPARSARARSARARSARPGVEQDHGARQRWRPSYLVIVRSELAENGHALARSRGKQPLTGGLPRDLALLAGRTGGRAGGQTGGRADGRAGRRADGRTDGRAGPRGPRARTGRGAGRAEGPEGPDRPRGPNGPRGPSGPRGELAEGPGGPGGVLPRRSPPAPDRAAGIVGSAPGSGSAARPRKRTAVSGVDPGGAGDRAQAASVVEGTGLGARLLGGLEPSPTAASAEGRGGPGADEADQPCAGEL